MAYKRTHWKSGAEGGTLVTDERLNNIEDGIEQALVGAPRGFVKEDPDDLGTYLITSGVIEDPADEGTFLIGVSA